MTTYSHSRLGTFQQCKYKFKLKYIDKVKVDVPDTVETFMGKLVHETLEKLYKDLKYQKLNSKKELLEFFETEWEKRWEDTIIIVKKELTQKNYKEMGKKYISDYYDHYKPFNHMQTIALETEYTFLLENSNRYHIKMDRLACDKDGTYYICDYKTNNSLKLQEELDEDRQLAMYSLWVKENFKDAKDVKLVWFFLAFDKKMISERSDEQLAQLKAETEALIRDVEDCKDFPVNAGTLCNWCEFKEICPAWKHEVELKKKTPKEFKDDDGVRFVDEYSKLEQMKKEAETQMQEIKAKLIEFSKQKCINVVWGSDKKAKISEYYKVIYPEDKEQFVELIKKKGIYGDVSSVNYLKLGAKILKNQVPSEIIEKVKTEKATKISLSKR